MAGRVTNIAERSEINLAFILCAKEIESVLAKPLILPPGNGAFRPIFNIIMSFHISVSVATELLYRYDLPRIYPLMNTSARKPVKTFQ